MGELDGGGSVINEATLSCFYSVYKVMSANGSVSRLHEDQNPCAQNIILDPYSMTPTNPNFPHSFNHLYNMDEPIGYYGYLKKS